MNLFRISSVKPVLFYILVVAILAVPAVGFYVNARHVIVTEAQKEATSIAITTSTFIEKDMERYRALSSIDDYATQNYDKSYYEEMQRVFRQIKRDTRADFIFTEKKVSDSEIAYILDGTDPANENFSPLGSRDAMQAVELRAFQLGQPQSTGLIHDEEWGDYITGFAPITDSRTGEILGLVGVDFSAKYVNQLLQNLLTLLILAQIIISFLGVVAIAKLIDIRNQTLNVDFLTSMYTKRFFDKTLRTAVRQADTTGEPFSLMMIDIDNFKKINDEYGHMVGDTALKIVGHMIKSNTRQGDLGCRFGGDEFAILLPNSTEDQAGNVSQRIQQSWIGNEFEPEKDKQVNITVSIGIVEWRPGMSGEEMVVAADKALYESKRKGKNQSTVFSFEQRKVSASSN